MILMNHGLLAFKAIVETGTVHAAANQLGLSQTAVTQRLKTLELQLGLTLFLRSRKGMSLTSDGAALLQYCLATEELEGAFLSRVTGATRSEVSVTLVGPTSAISTRLADDCKELYGKYPHLRLHLRSDDQSNRVDLVRRGEADLAVVSPEMVPNEMDSKVLKPDRYLLVAGAAFKGRRLHDIVENERVIDFDDNDSTTRKYLEQFSLASLMRKDRIFINENDALVRLFRHGVGYGTLTESVARAHLDSGELVVLNKGQFMEDPLALIWYPRPQKSDYLRDLVRFIK